jgi:hypothetical protein
MKHVKVRCLNEACPEHDKVTTILAGRPVAPGVTEQLGRLVCDTCEFDMFVEPVE